jgi:hypothetical protein
MDSAFVVFFLTLKDIDYAPLLCRLPKLPFIVKARFVSEKAE